MVIKTYPLGIYEENIYVLVDEKSRDACIVDPGYTCISTFFIY